jgi:hypothetical protein
LSSVANSEAIPSLHMHHPIKPSSPLCIQLLPIFSAQSHSEALPLLTVG